MPVSYMFYPVLVQVALTFVLLYAMGRARVNFLRTARMHPSKIALGEKLYPAEVVKLENSFHNQLELPVLFYTVTLFAIVFNQTDWPMLGLAVVFVISRIGHAFVHTGSNKVSLRAGIYAIGALALFLMWVWLAVKIAL